MKKLVIGTAVFFVMAFSYHLIWPNVLNAPCDTNKLKYSSTEISVKDRDFLKISMSFSYGDRLKRYLPYVKSQHSSSYFKKRKSKPWMSYITTRFRTNKAAKSAHKYLSRKWIGNKKNQYDVMLNGKTVTWFGNNRFTPQCFSHVVNIEKEKLKKAQPAIKKSAPKQRLAKKSKKIKKKSKGKRKISKKRKAAAKSKRAKKSRSKKKRRVAVSKRKSKKR